MGVEISVNLLVKLKQYGYGKACQTAFKSTVSARICVQKF